MGVGDPPLEAPYTLSGPLPAGTYGLVGDGIVLGPTGGNVTVRFDIVWRKKGVAAPGGTTLATFEHTFTQDPSNPFNAIAYQDQAPGLAASAQPGDQLVLQMTAVSGSAGAEYDPDGDGSFKNGRIPRIDLPQ